MGYGMKRGNSGVKFKDLRSDEVDLTKKPVGPLSNSTSENNEKKETKKEYQDPPAPGFVSMDADSYIKGQMLRNKRNN